MRALFLAVLFVLWLSPALAFGEPASDLSRETMEKASVLWHARQPLSRRLVEGRDGALAGRRIAISPGHGRFFRWETSSGAPFEAWDYQRGVMQDLREDTHNAQIALEFLIPMLELAGAEVVHLRERSYRMPEQLVDNDGAGYEETGAWSTSESAGFDGGSYRFAYLDPAGGSRAQWSFSVPQSGDYPLYVWFLASWNRSSEAHYVVAHFGGESRVTLDQNAPRVESWPADDYPNEPPGAADEGGTNGHWHYLGTFPLLAGESYSVELSSQGDDSEQVVIADALRVGADESGVRFLDQASGSPRWEEATTVFLDAMGLPDWLRVNDPVCRSLYACYEGVDAYLSLHTNCCEGSGTQAYTWYPDMWVGENSWPAGFADEELPPGTYEWSDAIMTHMVGAIRTLWDEDWHDYGHLGADFAELRPQRTVWVQDQEDGIDPPLTIPSVLVETAFHDSDWDTLLIEQLGWRHDIARAAVAGMIRYFEGSGAVTPPLAPAAVATSTVDGGVRVVWTSAPDLADDNAAPSVFRIYRSHDPLVFPIEPSLETSASNAVFELPMCETVYFRVSAANEAGESLPSPVVGVRRAPAGVPRVLWVNGIDREVRNVWDPTNQRDYARIWGPALQAAGAAAGFFDMATDDAVSGFLVNLEDYDAVAWSVGETSTWKGTVSPEQRQAIADYTATPNAAFWMNGAEIGWDLNEYPAGDSASFLPDVLHADYESDDAESTSVEAPETSPLAALGTFSFGDCSADANCVEWPDVLSPREGGRVLLWHAGSSNGAAVLHEADGRRVALFGFPIESVSDAVKRSTLVTMMTERMLPGLADAAWSCEEPVVAEPVVEPGEPGQDIVIAAEIASETGSASEIVSKPETTTAAETVAGVDVPGVAFPDVGGVKKGDGHSCSAGSAGTVPWLLWLIPLLTLYFRRRAV